MGASNPDHFEKPKQAVLEVVRTNKNSDVMYEVIQYGKDVTVRKSLGEKMDKKTLTAFLRTISWKEPGEALLDSVREAKVSFERYGRPKARRILVVFSDDKVKESLAAVKEVGNDLQTAGIKIVGVLVRNRGDEEKIRKLSGEKPLKIDDVDEPGKTGRDIAEEILKGKVGNYCL